MLEDGDQTCVGTMSKGHMVDSPKANSVFHLGRGSGQREEPSFLEGFNMCSEDLKWTLGYLSIGNGCLGLVSAREELARILRVFSSYDSR